MSTHRLPHRTASAFCSCGHEVTVSRQHGDTTGAGLTTDVLDQCCAGHRAGLAGHRLHIVYDNYQSDPTSTALQLDMFPGVS